MANKYLHPDVYDKGLDGLLAVAQAGNLRIVVLSAFTNVYAEASALYTGSGAAKRLSDLGVVGVADLTKQNRAGGGREVLVAPKTVLAAATISGNPDLHWALLDVGVGSQRVLTVFEETSDRPITAGDPLNIPARAVGFGPPA